MYKNYGLTGETVTVRHKSGDTDAYPWHGIAVPVLIQSEYPGYLLGLVLPHYAPCGFGLSKPYRVTLHKFDIEKGIIIIEGGK